MMTRKGTVMLAAALLMNAWGCSATPEVDRLRADNNSLRQTVAELQNGLAAAQAEADMLRNRTPEQDPALIAALEAERAARQADLEKYNATLVTLKEQIRALSQVDPGSGRMLPTDLDRALVALAKANPNLMTYDPKLGMIKFSSDLTFALGKADVNNEAATGLKQMARILNSDAAKGYEVRIVGHTDNVPVTSATGKQRFGDNWGLSAARAISVAKVLESAGVTPVRIGVAGHGEFRPVVPNKVNPRTGKKLGAEANRRVEIYLVPSSYDMTQAPSDEAGDASTGAGTGTGTGNATAPGPDWSK